MTTIEYSKPVVLEVNALGGGEEQLELVTDILDPDDEDQTVSFRFPHSSKVNRKPRDDQEARDLCAYLESMGYGPTAVVVKRHSPFVITSRGMGIVTHLQQWIPTQGDYKPIEVTWIGGAGAFSRTNHWPDDLVVLYDCLTTPERKAIEVRVTQGNM